MDHVFKNAYRFDKRIEHDERGSIEKTAYLFVIISLFYNYYMLLTIVNIIVKFLTFDNTSKIISLKNRNFCSESFENLH